MNTREEVLTFSRSTKIHTIQRGRCASHSRERIRALLGYDERRFQNENGYDPRRNGPKGMDGQDIKRDMENVGIGLMKGKKRSAKGKNSRSRKWNGVKKT